MELDKEVFSFFPPDPESSPEALRQCLIEYLPVFFFAGFCPLKKEERFKEFCVVYSSRKELGVLHTDDGPELFLIHSNAKVSRVILSKTWDTDMNSFHHPIFGSFSVTIEDFFGETCMDKFGTLYPALIHKNHALVGVPPYQKDGRHLTFSHPLLGTTTVSAEDEEGW